MMFFGLILSYLLLEVSGSESICDPGQRGLFLPLFGNSENREWDQSTFLGSGFRAVLYLFGLVWAFLGVGIISDVFMSAIETITSAERSVVGNSEIKVKVWNPTVANLTLMALGSSAPEILLSIIEILSNDFFTGDLGPSTIVGSAAFNLLVITGLCVAALSDGETRKIHELQVFNVTAFFSIFVYVWLLAILLGPWSPDVVELWEALVTLLFFPILIFMAYGADKKWSFLKHVKFSQIVPLSASLSTSHLSKFFQSDKKEQFQSYEFTKILRTIDRQNLTENEQAEIVGKIALQSRSRPSRASLRMDAIRRLTVQKRKAPKRLSRAQTFLARVHTSQTLKARVFFADDHGDISTQVAFFESDKVARLNVMRFPAQGVLKVSWKTRDGTARAGEDYFAASGELIFQPDEVMKSISIQIVDDDVTENDETFFVDLIQMSYSRTENGTERAVKKSLQGRLGSSTEVTIVDDDEPGEIGFVSNDTADVSSEKDAEDSGETAASVTATVQRISEAAGEVAIKVKRMNGTSGDITCKWTTENGTAEDGVHYDGRSGELVFKNHEIEKVVIIHIHDNRGNESRGSITDDSLTESQQRPSSKYFHLRLSDLNGPPRAAISESGAMMRVIIEPDQVTKDILEAVHKFVEENADLYLSTAPKSWADQFREAWNIYGGEETDEDDEKPGPWAYFVHILTLPWKLLFAFVPPTYYYGGWACFLVSLFMIGLVTAFIGDLAGLVGCVLGMPDSVTAITLVALGTSLPDALASKSAALSDDTADASVGNVTGSNSVNVILGLGLPWSIAAIYWNFFPSESAKKSWRNRYGGRDNDGGGGSKGPRGARHIGDSQSVAFVVPAGDLAFSVAVFVCCALVCFVILAYRRRVYDAELGGPLQPAKKHAAILISLWFIYVSFSSASSLGLFSS